MFTFAKREHELWWLDFILVPLALILAFAFGALFLMILDKPVWQSFLVLFEGAFTNYYALEDSLLKAIPIFLCSLGVAIAFKMKIWNIGAEGQYVFGAIGASFVVVYFPSLNAPLMISLMTLCAMLAGAFWAFIPAILKAKFSLNETVSSLLLNYIAILFLQFLVYGIWKGTENSGFPMTNIFPDNAILPFISGRIHSGLIFCLVVPIFIGIFLYKTRVGFEIKLAGENPKAANYAHIPYNYLVILVFCLSGALAALAGFIEISSTYNRLQANIAVGYGYTAIIVAWISRLRIVPIAIFSFLLAGIKVGTELLQIDFQVPFAFSEILEGSLLLIILAGQVFKTYKITRTKK